MPAHGHNCAFCTYLGSYTVDGSNVVYDLYFHRHRSGRATLKARYGSDQNEYHSWGGALPPPMSAHEILQVAFTMAVEAGGLITRADLGPQETTEPDLPSTSSAQEEG